MSYVLNSKSWVSILRVGGQNYKAESLLSSVNKTQVMVLKMYLRMKNLRCFLMRMDQPYGYPVRVEVSSCCITQSLPHAHCDVLQHWAAGFALSGRKVWGFLGCWETLISSPGITLTALLLFVCVRGLY